MALTGLVPSIVQPYRDYKILGRKHRLTLEVIRKLNKRLAFPRRSSNPKKPRHPPQLIIQRMAERRLARRCAAHVTELRH